MEQFAVIGLGQFGRTVAVTLAAAGHDVLAIDTDMAKVEEIKDHVVRAVRADAANEETMRALAVDQVGTAVIGLGEEGFEAAVLTVALLRQLGVPRIIARSSTRQRGRILEHVGADEVIYPEVEMAERVARRLSAKDVLEELCMPSGHTLAEIRVPDRLTGETLAGSRLREKFALNCIAVRRAPSPGAMLQNVEASPGLQFEDGDRLVVVAEREKIEAFVRAR